MGHCRRGSFLCCMSLTQGKFGCQVDGVLSSSCCIVQAERVSLVCEAVCQAAVELTCSSLLWQAERAPQQFLLCCFLLELMIHPC